MSAKFNKLVKKLLRSKGFALPDDGRDTPEFRAAIKEFQLREGLKPTETVTEETLSALREVDIPLPRPRPELIASAGAIHGDPDRGAFVIGDPGGIVEDGNIDLTRRPVVNNEDGTVSTVRSISFNEDGLEILVPTVTDEGKIVSDDEAIDIYHKTGQHLGKFDSVEAANNYARRVSLVQDVSLHPGLSPDDRELLLSPQINDPIARIDTSADVLLPIIVDQKVPTEEIQALSGLDFSERFKGSALSAPDFNARFDPTIPDFIGSTGERFDTTKGGKPAPRKIPDANRVPEIRALGKLFDAINVIGGAARGNTSGRVQSGPGSDGS